MGGIPSSGRTPPSPPPNLRHKRGGTASRKRILAVLGLVLTAASTAGAHATKPQRIVSLNVCTDQILVDLVPRARIAAVSILAADPSVSTVTQETRGLELVHIAAEEILALDPDLVLAGEGWTPATVDLLRRLGRRVVVVPLATNFDGIRDIVRIMAEAVGEHGRGEEIVAEFDRRLAAAQRGLPPRPSALAYQVNGLTANTGSLLDAMIGAAGLYNAAETLTMSHAGQISLEVLVRAAPDVVVLTSAPADFRTVVADNLRHPALAAVLRSSREVRLPMPFWLCGTPRIVDGIERLAAARDAVLGQSPR